MEECAKLTELKSAVAEGFMTTTRDICHIMLVIDTLVDLLEEAGIVDSDDITERVQESWDAVGEEETAEGEDAGHVGDYVFQGEVVEGT